MSTIDRICELWSMTPVGLMVKRPSVIEIPDVTRDDFALLLADLGFTTGVEIGTEFGFYAETLLKANPKLNPLICVDPYKAYKDYRDHTSQEKLDDIYRQAEARLSYFDGQGYIYRKPSVEAAAEFKDGQFDFVYIDGNHSLPYVIDDLQAWVPRVRKGGIVSGHDYIRRNNSLRYQCHVVEAVNAWVQCYMVNPLFIVGTKDEVAGQKRDVIRSWFWIKE